MPSNGVALSLTPSGGKRNTHPGNPAVTPTKKPAFTMVLGSSPGPCESQVSFSFSPAASNADRYHPCSPPPSSTPGRRPTRSGVSTTPVGRMAPAAGSRSAAAAREPQNRRRQPTGHGPAGTETLSIPPVSPSLNRHPRHADANNNCMETQGYRPGSLPTNPSSALRRRTRGLPPNSPSTSENQPPMPSHPHDAPLTVHVDDVEESEVWAYLADPDAMPDVDFKPIVTATANTPTRPSAPPPTPISGPLTGTPPTPKGCGLMTAPSSASSSPFLTGQPGRVSANNVSLASFSISKDMPLPAADFRRSKSFTSSPFQMVKGSGTFSLKEINARINSPSFHVDMAQRRGPTRQLSYPGVTHNQQQQQQQPRVPTRSYSDPYQRPGALASPNAAAFSFGSGPMLDPLAPCPPSSSSSDGLQSSASVDMLVSAFSDDFFGFDKGELEAALSEAPTHLETLFSDDEFVMDDFELDVMGGDMC